ncbi:uncharacterized protein LOC126815989 isoform X1 [Patella vulgata]|uniref:uncharacterized protein LOC126815989 isoform X1 n=2 Tax=Patella vulgata TaxID=6465 RepID=UPI0024A8C4B8|nr:uncharacterized protein LOC126815989 isoform X1 [Patella vulgata]
MPRICGTDIHAANALNDLRHSNIVNNVHENALYELVSEYFADSVDDMNGEDFDIDHETGYDEPDEIISVLDSAEDPSLADDFDVPVVLGAVDRHYMDNVHEDDDIQSVDEDNEGDVIRENDAQTIMGMVGELICDTDKECELRKIQDYQCSCAAFKKNGKCLKQLSVELIYEMRLNMSAMTDFEKDLVILGKLSTTMNRSEMTTCTKRSKQQKRQRQRTSYFVEGHQICRSAFEFIHTISGDKLDSCIKHYKEHGLTPRVKKSGGRRAERRYLTYDDIKRVVSYITSFTETHGIILPGRIPGFKDFTMKLLPSSETKASVFRSYDTAMDELGERAVKISSFRQLWNTLLPFIVFCKPQTDLCWTCQQNNYQVYRSHNLPDEVKNAKLRKQLGHLQLVEAERNEYRRMVADGKGVAAEIEQPLKLGPHLPMSGDFHMHYSFDFAQQVHIPSDPLQPGPMYFLVPRKCGLFGMNCEALPQQVNYLIDESASSSKGSSAVISYLHHFFETYGLGEKDLDMHCDNCSGQNKNRYMLWYLAWRVMHGLHRTVTLNFLITGHTKFAPDWCFGLIKQKFRKTRVCSLDEMSEVVSNSTTTGVNIPQQVVNNDGQVLVRHYDWQEMESDFKVLPGIKSYQHFRFTDKQPGTVYCKESVDSEEQEFHLLKSKDAVPQFRMPSIIPPPGLPPKRQWYLYDQIRDFCSEETRDITCPRPTVENDPAQPPVQRPTAEKGRSRGVKRGHGGNQGQKLRAREA